MIIITLIKSKKNVLFTFLAMNGYIFEYTCTPFTQRCFVPNLVEIGPVVLKKNI